MVKPYAIRERLINLTAELRRHLGTLTFPPGPGPVDRGVLARLTTIRGLLLRCGTALQGALEANDESDIRMAIQDYILALSNLRTVLQTLGVRLREERVRLQTEIRHVRTTTSWAQSAKLVR